jgi:hypothetical protein
MRSTRSWQGLELVVVLVILGSVSTSSHADPITIPGYTVTDLGAGTPTFSTDANGNGILNAPNGQIYAFPQTPNMVLPSGPGTTSNLPLPISAPVNSPATNGNPENAFAYVQSAVMNTNGVVAAIEAYGVNGHYGIPTAFVVQPNANGSWSVPVQIWQGAEQFMSVPPVPSGNLVVGINNLNQVLGVMTIGLSDNNTETALYNLNSHSLIDLSAQLITLGYSNVNPVALDDDGRILLSAISFSPSINSLTTDNLLLTPDGLSSGPLEIPAPEPGTLAVALLAIAGFIAHRLREHRRAA